jgi:hypothetical protein
MSERKRWRALQGAKTLARTGAQVALRMHTALVPTAYHAGKGVTQAARGNWKSAKNSFKKSGTAYAEPVTMLVRHFSRDSQQRLNNTQQQLNKAKAALNAARNRLANEKTQRLISQLPDKKRELELWKREADEIQNMMTNFQRQQERPKSPDQISSTAKYPLFQQYFLKPDTTKNNTNSSTRAPAPRRRKSSGTSSRTRKANAAATSSSSVHRPWRP